MWAGINVDFTGLEFGFARKNTVDKIKRPAGICYLANNAMRGTTQTVVWRKKK